MWGHFEAGRNPNSVPAGQRELSGSYCRDVAEKATALAMRGVCPGAEVVQLDLALADAESVSFRWLNRTCVLTFRPTLERPRKVRSVRFTKSECEAARSGPVHRLAK